MTGHPEPAGRGGGIKTIVHHRTLFYCDGPQVFEARDAMGGCYIAVLVGSDDRDARGHAMEQPSDRCLVARVAPGRLRLFRSGAIDLRSLLLESDPNEHYLATMDGGIHQPLQLDRLSTPLVDCGLLPDPGFLLHDEPRVPAPPRSSGEPGSAVGKATESVGGTIASIEAAGEGGRTTASPRPRPPPAPARWHSCWWIAKTRWRRDIRSGSILPPVTAGHAPVTPATIRRS